MIAAHCEILSGRGWKLHKAYADNDRIDAIVDQAVDFMKEFMLRDSMVDDRKILSVGLNSPLVASFSSSHPELVAYFRSIYEARRKSHGPYASMHLLPPGGKIFSHRDSINSPTEIYTLAGSAATTISTGVILRSTTVVAAEAGDRLDIINSSLLHPAHSIVNNGDTPRISLVV